VPLVEQELLTLPDHPSSPIFGEIWHEKFEYTNVVIRSHELKKDRQNNGQKKEDNRQ
jgi:hypothetical protein